MACDQIVAEFDAYLTPAERALVERAREFGRLVVVPAAAGWERERRHPTETLRAACAAGLAGVELPAEFGGLGLRYSAKMRMAEELAKYDFGFPFSLVNHHNSMVRIARSQSPLAQQLLPKMLRGEWIGCAALTEPEHGSDLAGLQTQARKVEGGWVLKGRKAWITNAAVASVFTTLAQTDPAQGAKGFASFIVQADQAGFREPAYDVPGIHAIGVGGFHLDDCFVSDEALLDPPGESFKRTLTSINGARCYVAAMCAGMLDAAVSLAVKHAARREAFGSNVLDFQGLRWSLVDAANDLAALRLLAYRAARQIDEGQNAEQAAAQAKKFAGDRTQGHLSACIQALGANGLRGEYPLMRHLAAAKASCYTDGTTEIMNERLGKLLAAEIRG